jgi:hypothetical protein
MSTTYRKNASYRFHLVSGGSEPAEYLGKNSQGMHKFLVSRCHLWTGHIAPVTEE